MRAPIANQLLFGLWPLSGVAPNLALSGNQHYSSADKVLSEVTKLTKRSLFPNPYQLILAILGAKCELFDLAIAFSPCLDTAKKWRKPSFPEYRIILESLTAAVSAHMDRLILYNKLPTEF